MDIFTLIFLSVITYIIYKIFINPDKFVNEFTFEPKKSSKYFGNYNEDEIVYVTEPNKEKPIKIAKEGLGSIPAKTFLSVMKDAINNHGNKVFMKKEYKDNNSEFKWNEWTLNEFHDDGMKAGRALIKLGLQQWKTVGFIGFNSPQWYIAQLGTMYAGGLVAGIYTTNNPGQCKYIAEHSKMQIVLVENKKQLDKFVKIKDELNDLKAIVIWDKSVTKDDELIIELNKKGNAKILTWNEFMDMGVGNDEMNDEIKKRQDIIKPGHCCLLIYTSGTTGPPKAVMISHDSLVWTASGIWNQVKTIKRTGEHSMVSYLPLSHVAAQLADFFFPLISLANHKKLDKFVVHFARNDALKGSLALTLRYARPTIFFGVPRVWEKFYEAIMKKRKQNPPGFIMSNIISILKNIGLQSFNNKQLTGNMVKPFGYILFEKILRAKVLKGLGFDRLQAGVCGAAPPQRSTLNFFGSMGIHIIEVYGMSESTGLICSTLPYNYIIGSVGVLFEGCEVYLDHIDGRDKVGHGEICIRGRLVMNGYMYNDNKTSNTIDKQGWLHSGDIGTFTKINKNGIEYEILSITGRIKELIVTAGGENVAPVPIENYIKNILKGISNIIIIGDQKKYLTCLITLKCKQDLDTLKYSNELDSDALTIDSNCTTVDDAKKSKIWNDYINAGIKTYNNDKNVCVSNAQKIQYFSVLHGDFSVATGEMTDTMKLKRAIIYKNYLDVIESMYNKTKK